MATILENVYALSAHLKDAYDALEAKGATIPATKNATNLSATIDTVQSGISPTDLFNADLDLVFTGLSSIPTDSYATNEQGKFSQWKNIKSVSFPDLTSVGAYGCYKMFLNCKSLTAVPSLPATTLAERCYYNMFYNCLSLTTTPDFPAAKLATNCYSGMFKDCIALTGTITIPVLNTSTSIPNGAFQAMFVNCPNLTKVILDFSTFSSIPTLGVSGSINVFNNTTDTRLEIHVPSALEESWKTASNWSTWESHIVGV